MPKALVEWDIPFEMVITNKSGKVIYKTSDKNEGWNGKLNNTGQQMQEGIYFWKIVTKDFENNPHYHQGEIKLVKQHILIIINKSLQNLLWTFIFLNT